MTAKHRRRRRDDRRTSSRLHPPPPARPHRARQRHQQTARKSASPASLAAPESTAPSSTATATCSNASTPPKPSHPTNQKSGPPSPAPHCRPTCSPPSNAAPAWPPASTNSRHRLSELLGEQAWRASGLGAPTDIDQLQQRIVTLEQQVVDLRLQLEERDQDLAAARAANRELMTQAQRIPANRMTHPRKCLHNTCCAL